MGDHMRMMRKMDFPECTRAALKHLCSTLGQDSGGIPGLGGAVEEAAEPIMQEFIFFQSHSRKLSAVQELQLLQLILNCLSHQKHSMRYRLFLTLFGGSLPPVKQGVLVKLVSMAICLRQKSVLNCAAKWLLEQGCVSRECLDLAAAIVHDYCVLSPASSTAFVSLFKLNKLLACSLMTAACNVYRPTGKIKDNRSLPLPFAEIISDWCTNDPNLCLECVRKEDTSSSKSKSGSLWSSTSYPGCITPVPGLVRQCVAAQVYHTLQSDRSENAVKHLTVYTKLHLAVLNTMLASKEASGGRSVELLSFRDMVEVKELLLSARKKLSDSDIEGAVDRYGQVIQVALATGALRLYTGELGQLTSGLQNRFLDMIKRKHETEAMDQS